MKVLLLVMRRSYIAVALLCLLAIPSRGVAQAAAQEEDLPADDIIEILQQNPDLLAEAKAQIVAHLRDRGYPVTERSITDDRLFAEIRSDDRARHVMSDELKKRGFGAEERAPSDTAQQQLAAPATNLTGNRPAPNNQPAAATATSPVGTRPPGPTRERGTTQDQYPFRNRPALHDLYKQAVLEPATLERFGAALFRNSATATADKAPIDIPVGPDYVIGPGDELIVEYWGT